MGKHTAYWEEYTRSQVRGTLRMRGAILAWVVVVTLLSSESVVLTSQLKSFTKIERRGSLPCASAHGRRIY